MSLSRRFCTPRTDLVSNSQRRKGRDGQSLFARMLADRDWIVDPITSGVRREDMVAGDSDGGMWSIEVKNCAGILPAHRKQAMDQAKRRGLRWMLASHIAGTSCWLVQRQGADPVVWREKESKSVVEPAFLPNGVLDYG